MESQNEEPKNEERKIPSQEMLEKIGMRTSKILAFFFDAVKSDADYNKMVAEGDPAECGPIEATALMQAAAAITTSVIFSIHRQGVAINCLLDDHITILKGYLTQAEVKDDARDPQIVDVVPDIETVEPSLP